VDGAVAGWALGEWFRDNGKHALAHLQRGKTRQPGVEATAIDHGGGSFRHVTMIMTMVI